MSHKPYPVSLDEIEMWSKLNKTTTTEGKKRFIQFLILQSIANSKLHIVFKGGNALRFIYNNPRSTIDLDFSARENFPDNEDSIREVLDKALFLTSKRFGLGIKCQKIKQNPKGINKTMPTFSISVAYQFRNDRFFNNFFESNINNIPTIIEIEISFNDLVCEDNIKNISEGTDIIVCSLEDIISEKLRALLQQPVRKRYRYQDVFDIAYMKINHNNILDLRKIT